MTQLKSVILLYFVLNFFLPHFFKRTNHTAHSETIAEVNSNVYFKPKLDYFSKEKTGLSILVLNKESEITINNPFFSKSGYYIEKLKGYKKYQLKIKNKVYYPNHHGKINLAPFNKGRHELKISWGSQSIDISPTVKDKSTSLHLLILPYDNFAPIIGEYQSNSVLNMGYKKIYRCLNKVSHVISQVQDKSFSIENSIDKTYRDDLGKAKDFIAYLKIQYAKLTSLKVDLVKVKLLDSNYLLDIQGSIKFKQDKQIKYDYQLNLNHNFEIISYKNNNEVDKKASQ
ncbi:MAG: hypothetical protein KC646_14850 [Candidatus Cloacimonetes bacterium]|nr:hypothetical protein [Candidatus Cloacimonadota bacterium]